MPGQVDIDHRLPILGEHVVEHLVPQDAGGVEHDVQPAQFVARLLHHLEAIVELGDRAEIGDRFAAFGLDLVGHRLRRSLAAALARAADTGIDDDDLGAFPGHQFGDFRAHAARGAGANRDLPVEHSRHRSSSSPNLAPAVDAARVCFVNSSATIGARAQKFSDARLDTSGSKSDLSLNRQYCEIKYTRSQARYATQHRREAVRINSRTSWRSPAMKVQSPRIPSVGGSRSGTITVIIPAATAERTPLCESSSARQACGATPSRAAAVRNGSGGRVAPGGAAGPATRAEGEARGVGARQ